MSRALSLETTQFYILRAEDSTGLAIHETPQMRVEAGPCSGLRQAYLALSQGWQPQATEQTESVFLDTNTPVFISPHPVAGKPCMLVAAPFVEAARQGRSNGVALETSCLIKDGPDASEDIAACNQQVGKSLSRTAPAQAACYQQAGKSLLQTAAAQAALPQQQSQAVQQKTQTRKAARGLAALDYAYFVVQHLPRAAVHAPDKSTCVLLESGPHKDLPAAQQHAGQPTNVPPSSLVRIPFGTPQWAVAGSTTKFVVRVAITAPNRYRASPSQEHRGKYVSDAHKVQKQQQQQQSFSPAALAAPLARRKPLAAAFPRITSSGNRRSRVACDPLGTLLAAAALQGDQSGSNSWTSPALATSSGEGLQSQAIAPGGRAVSRQLTPEAQSHTGNTFHAQAAEQQPVPLPQATGNSTAANIQPGGHAASRVEPQGRALGPDRAAIQSNADDTSLTGAKARSQAAGFNAELVAARVHAHAAHAQSSRLPTALPGSGTRHRLSIATGVDFAAPLADLQSLQQRGLKRPFKSSPSKEQEAAQPMQSTSEQAAAQPLQAVYKQTTAQPMLANHERTAAQPLHLSLHTAAQIKQTSPGYAFGQPRSPQMQAVPTAMLAGSAHGGTSASDQPDADATDAVLHCGSNTVLEHVDTANSSNMVYVLTCSAGSLNSSTPPVQLASMQHCSSSLGDMHGGVQGQLDKTEGHAVTSGTAQACSRNSAAASFCTVDAASAAVAKRQRREQDAAGTASGIVASKEECPAPPQTVSASMNDDAYRAWNVEQHGLGAGGHMQDNLSKAHSHDALGGHFLTQLTQPKLS